MKNISFLSLAILALAGPADADSTSVESLDWLTGCWASVGGEEGSGEQWTKPAGGSLLGMSRTIRGGTTVAWEFLVISEDDDGNIVLTATPSGQPNATFTLLRLSDSEVVFQNLSHDFPQRVMYRLMPEKTLLGRIEGTVDGETRAVDFPLRKAECHSSEASSRTSE
jgi:hypothetical protein